LPDCVLRRAFSPALLSAALLPAALADAGAAHVHNAYCGHIERLTPESVNPFAGATRR